MKIKEMKRKLTSPRNLIECTVSHTKTILHYHHNQAANRARTPTKQDVLMADWNEVVALFRPDEYLVAGVNPESLLLGDGS